VAAKAQRFRSQVARVSTIEVGPPVVEGRASSVAYVTLLSIEVLAVSRPNLRPHPRLGIFSSILAMPAIPNDHSVDAVSAIVCAVSDATVCPGDGEKSQHCAALINLASLPSEEGGSSGIVNMISSLSVRGVRLELVADETALFDRFVSFVQQYDPDLVLGYEVICCFC